MPTRVTSRTDTGIDNVVKNLLHHSVKELTGVSDFDNADFMSDTYNKDVIFGLGCNVCFPRKIVLYFIGLLAWHRYYRALQVLNSYIRTTPTSSIASQTPYKLRFLKPPTSTKPQQPLHFRTPLNLYITSATHT